MLDTHLTDGHEPVSVLPDSLRRAVIDSVHGRETPPLARQARLPEASFRERLEARRAVRPQSTLAIASGVQHPRLARDAARRAAPVRPARPKRPVGAGDEPLADRTPLMMRAMSSMSGALPAITLSNGLSLGGDGHDGDDGNGMGARMAKLSQLAFAGLAVLGFAGLSVMAADNALSGSEPADGDEDAAAAETRAALEAATRQRITASQASALAMADASAPAGTGTRPWFDYKAMAFDIAARKEAQDAAQRAADAAASAEAERHAVAAIAEAEAGKLAEQQRLDRLAEATRLADLAIEKRRLAEEEARRVAEQEAIRLANLQAEREAAARAEALRLADLEARRIAQAETEARRLANLEAERRAEARRIAAAEVRALRTDVRLASAADTITLPMAPTPTVKPLVKQPVIAAAVSTVAAHDGPVPGPASLKPSRPLVLVAQAPVRRASPPSLKPNAAHVRNFDRPQPVQPASQRVEDFVAGRVQSASATPVDAAALEAVRAEFLSVVNTAQDGTVSLIALPDGTQMQVAVEQTTTRTAYRPVVRQVSYTVSEYSAVQRSVVADGARSVDLTCRDMSYEIGGRERGRFAACESGKGEWLISRASETGGSTI